MQIITEPSDEPETSSSTPPEQSTSGGYPSPQYPYPPSPYYPAPYPGLPPAQAAAPKNGFGTASLLIALVGLVAVWSVFGGVLFGIAAVATGFVGYSRAKRHDADNGGVAIAGIALGFLAIIVSLIFIAIWIGVWKGSGVNDFVDCVQKVGPDRASQQQCVDRLNDRMRERFNITLTPSPAPRLP